MVSASSWSMVATTLRHSLLLQIPFRGPTHGSTLTSASMVGIAFGAVGSKKADVEVAQAEAPQFQKVSWWQDRNMRKLYFYCSVLLIVCTIMSRDIPRSTPLTTFL